MKHPYQKPQWTVYGIAARVSLAYALIAGVWIYASDTLVAALAPNLDTARLQTYKGWLFVVVTALLLYGAFVVTLRKGAQEHDPSAGAAAAGAASDAEMDDTAALRRPWTQQAAIPVLIFAALAAAIGVTGWLTYTHERVLLQHDRKADLAAVADTKVAEISRWLEERRGLAQLITTDPFLAGGFRRWLANGNPADERRAELVGWLGALQRSLGFESLAIVNSDGGVLLNTAPVVLDAAGRDRIRASLASGAILISDLYRVDAAESGSSVAFDVIAPLGSVHGSHQPADEALLLRVDAAHYLFPLVQTWPAPSRTAETLLVRREGDDILFLNALRHASDPPMTVRRSIHEPDLPSARALRGEEGPLESIDYRGVPVLAVARRVPGTEWMMIAKIDANEVYGPLYRIALATAAVVAICIVGAGAGIGLWWRDQRARYMAYQLRTRLERQALVRHFDYLSKYANDIILLSDERGCLVEVNARAEQVYGYRRDELIGRDVDSLHDPAARGFARQQAALRQPAEGLLFETRHRRRDGSYFPVEVSSRTIDVEGRQFRHSIVRDITERVEAEKRARELDEQLRRVGIANELGQMISSIAHELRQPLTAAMNYANACRRLLATDPAPPAKALAMAEKAGEQIRRADLFVSDLRAFIQNRASDYAEEEIVSIVDEIMPIALMGTSHLGLAVRSSHGENLPRVCADRIRVQQVLLNLLRNAVEAMSSAPRRELSVETRLSSPDEVEIAVGDTGCGIPPDVAKRLFEPFVTSKTGGMGIGLPVCRSIIEAHGGRLWAENRPEGGTIFRFTLPVAGDAGAPG